MPGMSGPELARVVQERRPDIKIVLTSGYVGEEAVPSGLAFVPKPCGWNKSQKRSKDVRAKPEGFVPGRR